MQDVLLHYLEVNFADIAEQLAHARGEQPTAEQRAAAAERLRNLIRQLRQSSGGVTPRSPSGEPSPWRTVDEMAAATGIHVEPDERAVLDHFFELFARSMERTTFQRSAAPALEKPKVEGVVADTAARLPAEVSAEGPAEGPAEVPVEAPPARPAARQIPGWLPTLLQAAAQQAVDLLQVDASQVFTVGEDQKFVLRAAVPPDSLTQPDAATPLVGGLLARALGQTEVLTVEDLAQQALTREEEAWLEAGYHGFAAIALAPPLEPPVGVLALFRRTPWRLHRKDALRLEDLAAEAVAALRPNSLAVKVEEVAGLQERIKLAREIHDGLASDLAAVVALFKYYEQRRERDPEDAATLLPQLRGMTEEVLAGARNVLEALRPKTVRSEGLLASVLKVVDQFGRMHTIEANAQIRGDENGLSPEQKEGIFQVLRESLSNVRKHAQARTIWVGLDLSTTPWVLSVRDDGRGFEVSRIVEGPINVGSYGLLGMRERADLLDGILEVTSYVGEGTTVTLTGPRDIDR